MTDAGNPTPPPENSQLAELLQDVEDLRQVFFHSIENVTDLRELEEVKNKYLSKKGEITGLVKGIAGLPNELKPVLGGAINSLRVEAENAWKARQETFEAAVLQEKLARVRLDFTLDGIRTQPGKKHPLTQTIEELVSVFRNLGYSFFEYPEVETDVNNFDMLNTPDWHPARDMHDTFYLEDGRLLRTHTTAFQGHAMRLHGEPPLREITLGRCYRKDTLDATHSPMFHQLDGMAISEHCTFAELKWTLYHMAREMFGSSVEVRFRPSFFPFTTPSAEMDVRWKHGWVEILGSGMMRPEVLRNGGLDPERYRGFAFGMGLDRITMLRYGIDDIRLLFENDVEFLRQF